MKKGKLMGKIFGIALVLVMIGAMLGGLPALVSKVEASPGTIYVPDNYPTIQAAVDAASPGDTIIVRDGTYTENVDVNKEHLMIQSESGAETTIVQAANPNDHVFDVTADDITIKGFKLESVADYSGVLLDKVAHCDILNNILTGEGSGITLTGSSDNDISNNNVYSLPGNGIDIRDSSQRNKISGNNFNQNHYGIFVSNGSSYNVISANCINSSDWSGIRLNWEESNFQPVVSNNITNNFACHNHEGIFLDYPSVANFVDDNFVSDNYIGIRLRQANNGTVVHNTVISNSYRGISAESSYGNTVCDNFLNNTNNAWDNGVNSWNTAKQTGPNIIGGPYVGGNYWSDNPNPVDGNGDGLGDLPYDITGGTNKDSLPLVTRLSIFIASFITPEREPYPFDVTISNGTSKVAFANVTHIVTQWPENGTFTLVYRCYSLDTSGNSVIDSEMYQQKMNLPDGEIRNFEFYALNLSSVVMLARPYIYGKEIGANVSLSWEYVDNASLSFHLEVTPSDKRAFVTFWLDNNLDATPNVAIPSLGWHEEGQPKVDIQGYSGGAGAKTVITFLEAVCHAAEIADFIDEHMSTDIDDHWVLIGQYGYTWWETDSHNWAWCSSPTDVYYNFVQIPEDKVQLGLRWMLRNGALVPYCYAFDMTLTDIEDGVILKPQYIDPQFAVSQGSYILQFEPLISGYLQLSLPINVSAAQISDVYPLEDGDLTPFSFAVVAETPFSHSAYSNLVHNIHDKTLSIDVTTDVPRDWWGCFVLPETATVAGVLSWEGDSWHQLVELYDYTINAVEGYDIVVVRITPKTERLALKYAPVRPCFIATAAYGTPMAEEIQILREFRDEYLLTNPPGRAFVDFYYRVSPPIAEFITEHPCLKPIVRAGLLPAVAMSAVAVNATPAEKAAIIGLLALISVAVAVWATRRRSRGSEHT